MNNIKNREVKPFYTLGISCFYHDSAAVLLKDENIFAAAQEERFTRIRHDESFPIQAINYCLREAGISSKDLGLVAFYDKPFVKLFDRILDTYLAIAPKGFSGFRQSLPTWTGNKIGIRQALKKT